MSDSESSNSDLFFDAEESGLHGPSGSGVKTGQGNITTTFTVTDTSKEEIIKLPDERPGKLSSSNILTSPLVENQIEILTGDQLSARDQRWSRLERLRRREDEEDRTEGEHVYQNQPSCDSTESSVEGIYLTGVRSLHPFKVVEPDSRSAQSDVKSVARSSVSGFDLELRNRVSIQDDLFQHHLSREASVGEVGPSQQEEPAPGAAASCSNVKDDSGAGCSGTAQQLAKPNISVKSNFNVASAESRVHVPDIVSSSKPPYGGVVSSSRCDDSISSDGPAAPPRRKRGPASGGAESGSLGENLSRQSSQDESCMPPPVTNPSSTSSPPSLDSGAEASCGRPHFSDAGKGRPHCLPVSPATPPTVGKKLGDVSPPALPSPHTTVDSLTRDLEKSLLLSPTHPDYNLDKYSGLNISLACRGEFVVKPQDDDKTKGQAYLSDRPCIQQWTDSSSVCLSPEPAVNVSSLSTGGAGGTLGRQSGSEEISAVLGSFDRHASPDMKRSSMRSNRVMIGGSGGKRSDGHHSGGSGGHHSIGSGGHLSGGSGGHHSGGSGGHLSGGSGGHHSGRSTAASFKGGSGGSDRRSIGSGGSADATGIVKQLGMSVRLKSDSGKKLSDLEILQQIKVKNLDTGLEMDLATAEKQLPQSINPLSLHIMRLTSEYAGTQPESIITSIDSDTESVLSCKSDFEIGEGKKKKTMTKLLGGVAKVKKSATRAAKIISSEVTRRQLNREENMEEKLGTLATDISTTDGVQVSCKDGAKAAAGFKRIQAHKSGPYDFENIQFGQDLSGHHTGPIWCMKFSLCGRLLATAGQDFILRIWVLQDKHGYFVNMRRRFQQENEGLSDQQDDAEQEYLDSVNSQGHIFMNRPFVTYTGHTSDLLDISWSKNFFILTSSMDKTVRLWHISRKECLCVFQHIDFVTAIAFHPRNDQFFLSGSLDGKLRLWNIPDKKVTLWNEVDGSTKLITAANFCQNGKFACVGTYDGRVIFYSTDQLKYHTTIHVRSSRGKNSIGRKVTGIEPQPGEDKILVTSTDSRIRLYDLRDLSLVCKYKGYTNLSSQIRACFSPDGRYICAGSENQCVFLWSTLHHSNNITARKDRNNYYEAIRAHNAAVTCTLFAPVPELIFEAVQRGREAAGKARNQDVGECSVTDMGGKTALTGYVVISGDYDGDIKVFIKEGKRSSLPR